MSVLRGLDSPPEGTAEASRRGEARSSWMPIRIGVMLSVAVAVCATISTLTTLSVISTHEPSRYREVVAALADAMIEDSDWLLPLLFGAVLAVLAVLVGQSFSDIPAKDADLNRRRLAVSSWVLAGLALSNLTLCFLSLVAPSKESAHLWAITVATALLMAAALWIGSFVFDPAEQQLRVLGQTERDLQCRLRSLPEGSNIVRPWRHLAASAVVTLAGTVIVTAVVTVIGATALGQAVNATWMALLVPVAGVAAAGCGQGLLIAYQRDNSLGRTAGLLDAAIFTGVAVLPAGVLGIQPQTEVLHRLILTSLLVAYLAPIAAAYLPRTAMRGRTLRGSIDSLRFSWLRRRILVVEEERAKLEQVIVSARQARPRHST